MRLAKRTTPDELEGDAVRHEVRSSNGYITLMPAYEYYAEIGQTREGAMARQSLVTHPDYLLENTDVPVLVRVDYLYCFAEMSDDDRALHEGFLQKAQEQAAALLEKKRPKIPRLILVPGS